MIATVNQGYRTTLLTEVHLPIITFYVEITVNKQSPLAECAPEGFLPIQIHFAVPIDRRAIKCIVGTFEMTVFIVRIIRTIERIKIQTTDKTDIFSSQRLPMNIPDMRLRDALTPFLTGKSRIERIVKVHIAEVTQRHVFYRQFVTPEIEHGEITDSPLHLSTL